MRGFAAPVVALLAVAALGAGAPARALPSTWGFIPGGCNTSVTKVVAITSGSTYTIPSDYCSLVEVDAIGSGSSGEFVNGVGANGGWGGDWAQITTGSYTPGQSIPITIGTGGGIQGTCTDVNTTWVNSSTLLAATGNCSSTSVGSTTHAGGHSSFTVQAGGGAGGPGGAGGAGSGSTGGVGGAGFGGVGGSSGTATGGNGGTGLEYSLTAGGAVGSGGGGGGCNNGASSCTAGHGGLYGGGGGTGHLSSDTSGVGEPGLIVLQYHPK